MYALPPGQNLTHKRTTKCKEPPAESSQTSANNQKLQPSTTEDIYLQEVALHKLMRAIEKQCKYVSSSRQLHFLMKAAKGGCNN